MHPKIVLSEKKENFVADRWKEKQTIRFEISSTYLVLIWSIFLLLIYYIWTINVNATIWFNIRELEQEKNELQLEQERLWVILAELESLDNVKDEDYENMERAEDPDYLVIREWINYVYND